MVIMENYHPQEYMQQLWSKIDSLHLEYVRMEDNEKKIEQRSELEEWIGRYLTLVEPSKKFIFQETGEILYKSAAQKNDFSGYKAASGWNGLQMYAAHLLKQPWRKEYREIKTYCGFYKYNIEANLLGVEKVFEAMGYRQIGNGVLVLRESNTSYETLLNISKDCLIAYVECQILKHIWENLSPDIEWLNILKYRRMASSNIERCIKYLRIRPDLMPAPEQNYSYNISDKHRYPTSPNNQIAQMTPINNYSAYHPTLNHGQIHLSSTLRPTARTCCVSHCPTQCHQCQYPYCVNTISMQQSIPPPPPPPAAYIQNGYYCSNTLPLIHHPSLPSPVSAIGYSVPAAIPIHNISNPSNNFHSQHQHYDTVDSSTSSKIRRSRTDSNVILSDLEKTSQNGYADMVKNGSSNLMRNEKRQESGENWDYVYKNLEEQGYTKDLGERGDLLRINGSEKRKSEEPKTIKVTNLDEAMNTLILQDGPKYAEVLKHFRELEKPTQSKQRRNSRTSSYDNVSGSETPSAPKCIETKTVQINYIPKLKLEKSKNKKSTTSSSNDEVVLEKYIAKDEDSTSSWNCKECTYLNEPSRNICCMCNKSKNFEKLEEPKEVGIKKCEQCTLVNSMNATKCDACQSTLEDSPTYI